MTATCVSVAHTSPPSVNTHGHSARLRWVSIKGGENEQRVGRTLSGNPDFLARDASGLDGLRRLSLGAVDLSGVEMRDTGVEGDLADLDGLLARAEETARAVAPSDGGDELAVRELDCAGHCGSVRWEEEREMR